MPRASDLCVPKEEPDRGELRLQVAFAIAVDAPCVVLMGCGSGTQDVSLNDNVMDLISAFFAAGATSVIRTLWPTDIADALNSPKLSTRRLS